MDRPVERQFAEEHAVGNLAPLDHSLRGEDAERNREVERGAGLSHVGRRQIHRDPVGWKLEPGVADRGAHPIAALPNARIRQADHREAGKAERDVHLHVDRTRINTEDGGGPKAGQHRLKPCKGRDARAHSCLSVTCADGPVPARSLCTLDRVQRSCAEIAIAAARQVARRGQREGGGRTSAS